MIASETSIEWPLVRLSDVIEIAHGFAFRGEFFAKSGRHAVTTPGNFYENGGFRQIGDKQRYFSTAFPDSYRLLPGDLIVAMTEQATGLLGSAAIVPSGGSYLHNQRIGRVRTKSKDISLRYLFYVFNSEAFRKKVNQTAAGTKVRHTSPSKLTAVAIRLPSLAEQIRIGDLLCDSDSMVAELEGLIARKQAIKQGMMQQLLTGAIRLPGFVEAWQRLRITEVLAPRTERNERSESLDVLSCTKHRGFVRSLDFFKNQVFSRDLSNYLLIHRGDIGYPANHVEEGSIGVQEVVERGLVSPIYVVMSVLDGHDTYFLQRQLKLESFRQEFARVTNASVNRRGSLRWKEFSQIRVLVPSQAEQHAVSSVLRDAESEIATLQDRLTKAKAIRQGMMQELLTGRTRLPVRGVE